MTIERSRSWQSGLHRRLFGRGSSLPPKSRETLTR